ncbi:family 10 glycosylhydrolase [Enterococcus sp. LJL99]
MKRKGALACLLFFCSTLISGTALAENQPLYKYTKNAEGTLGYDTKSPVPFYENATEFVTLPSTYSQPKHQFKSTWVATIANLNMPQPTSEADFKASYLERLQTLSDWNMNAMIFQVRPLLDAWYPSELNPWSEFLSGSQGTDPGYDPLKWMIDVTHEAGMEYHAWFNPYRVTNTKLSDQSTLDKLKMSKDEVLALSTSEQVLKLKEAGILAPNNYAAQHPENVLMFDEKLFLNPGIPEVQSYVIDSMKEVVENYDIDAIHFDDYFYPYRITVGEDNVFFGDKNEDQATFEKYGKGYTDIEEWRRDNITHLVSGVKSMLDSHNKNKQKAVQFGISPFGIWEHKTNDSRGSNTPTTSSQSYSSSIFADTYKWVKEETVDYIIPQIYWSFDQKAAPYGELTRWWNNVAEGSHSQVYVGHANYKHATNGGWEVAWLNPEEIPNQMKFNQQYDNIDGSVLFSYNDLIPSDIPSLADNLKERNQAKNQAIELLKNEYFSTPSLVPEKPWLSHQAISAPISMNLVQAKNQATLTWKDQAANQTRYFVVYKGTGTAEEVTANPGNIVKRLFKKQDQAEFSFVSENDKEGTSYYVTAVDAAGVESEPTKIVVPEVVPDEKKTTGKITVSYLTEDKKQLTKENLVLEGEIDTPYKTEAKEFAGYELVETPKNATGKFTEQEQNVVYIYRTKTSTSTTEETKISTTSTTEKKAAGNDETTKPTGKSFPSTGESTNHWLTLAGIFLLGFSVKYFFSKKRSQITKS